MTTLANHLWGVIAADATVLSIVADGTASLLGADTSAQPSGSLDAPWGLLGLGLDVPLEMGFTLGSSSAHSYSGEALWTFYDDPQAGYVRLRRLALAVLTAYPRAAAVRKAAGAQSLWRDTASGAAIYSVGPCVRGFESIDQDTGQLLAQVRVPYRWTLAKVAA